LQNPNGPNIERWEADPAKHPDMAGSTGYERTLTVDNSLPSQCQVNSLKTVVCDRSVLRRVVVVLGAGDDLLQVIPTLPVTATGGNGNDRLIGGPRGDQINGDAGADRIDGNGGSDRISGGPGNDTIYGRAGSDVIQPGSGSDTVSGSTGTNTLDYSDHTGATSIDLRQTCCYGSGDFEFDRSDRKFGRIIGGSGNDEIHASPLVKQYSAIDGRAGNDSLYGGAIGDRLYGGEGQDLLDGGPGHDIMLGGPANDYINAKDGSKDRTIDCGNGYDVATIDKSQDHPYRCNKLLY
jgi:Ca2+-binding RTX toxin-like protein